MTPPEISLHSQNAPLPWERPLPNLWITFLLHFRRIFLGVLGAMIIAAGISLLLPKTYRSSSTVVILPPRYVNELVTPPTSLSMPAVQAIATSESVLQALLADLSIKRTLRKRMQERDSLLAEGMSTMSATTAAEIFQMTVHEDFVRAWGGMPPEDLLPGLDDFRDHDLDQLDPNELSKHLTATIRTSVETNLTTRFQPLLTLSAEWRTPASSAVLSFLWVQATLRAMERDIIDETLLIQEERVKKVEEVVDLHLQTRVAPYEFLAERPIDVAASEVAALERLRLKGPLSATDEARLRELGDWIVRTEGDLEALRREYERSIDEFEYTLGRFGGVEATVEDYPLVLRSNLLGPPTPPAQKISPRRSAIVLACGAVVFVFLLGQAQLREMRRADHPLSVPVESL